MHYAGYINNKDKNKGEILGLQWNNELASVTFTQTPKKPSYLQKLMILDRVLKNFSGLKCWKCKRSNTEK